MTSLDSFFISCTLIQFIYTDCFYRHAGGHHQNHTGYTYYNNDYAGFSPSTYQSGQLDGAYAHMEKRGSRYLRYALYNATKYVCHWDPTFAAYLAKKRAEGKHYNVAISHAVKKLVRVIYHLEKTKQQYIKAT
jgi:hypothetical protein